MAPRIRTPLRRDPVPCPPPPLMLLLTLLLQVLVFGGFLAGSTTPPSHPFPSPPYSSLVVGVPEALPVVGAVAVDFSAFVGDAVAEDVGVDDGRDDPVAETIGDGVDPRLPPPLAPRRLPRACALSPPHRPPAGALSPDAFHAARCRLMARFGGRGTTNGKFCRYLPAGRKVVVSRRELKAMIMRLSLEFSARLRRTEGRKERSPCFRVEGTFLPRTTNKQQAGQPKQQYNNQQQWQQQQHQSKNGYGKHLNGENDRATL